MLLSNHLRQWGGDDAERGHVVDALLAIASAATDLSELIGAGPLLDNMAEIVGENTDGDQQKSLDLRAHQMFVDAFRSAPIAVIGSEEADEPVVLEPAKPLAIAIDPLDGSSNIDTNVSIGTIFAIYPMSGATNGSAASALLQKGTSQLAAGFVVYGPQTTFVLTVGEGTHFYTLDRADRAFKLTAESVRVPAGKAEYAINSSNMRHWEPAVRSYIDECLQGAEGPRGKNFNTRWVASLVADCFRILVRGGVFLYPRDQRPGYEKGRLRLVYEVNPIAFILEQAGGAAIDGRGRVRDLQPGELHERAPLIFGAADEVELIQRYHTDPPLQSKSAPLFGERGLFRS